MVVTKTLQLALASSPFFAPSVTTSKRVQALSQYFDPPPNSMVHIHSRYLKNKDAKKHLYELPGFITVNPPKGICFTVSTEFRLRDKRVCRKKTLRFKLGDITQTGQIEWLIRTDKDDFGTTLRWQTPYRAGRKRVLNTRGQQQMGFFYVEGCNLLKNYHGERLLDISIFDQPNWQVRLPNKEKFIRTPFEKRTTLYFKSSESKNVFQKSKKKRREERLRKIADKQKILRTVQEMSPRYTETRWQTKTRGAYSISAERVHFDGQTSMGSKKGICLYKYFGYDKDPNVGVVECHDIAGYLWIAVPLNCLSPSQETLPEKFIRLKRKYGF